MNRRHSILLLGLLGAFAGWLFYTCDVNPKISFLTPGPGRWIIYPTPPSVPLLDVMSMTTVFRGAMVLPQTPASATISWRCFKSGELFVNGQKVAATSTQRWKDTSRMDIASRLHPGTNTIEARVACDNGLPGLTLNLDADGLTFQSDESWTSSLEGAAWLPASAVSNTVEPAPGNGLYGTADIGNALAETWPLLALFLIASAVAAVCLQRWGGSCIGIVLLTGAWALLFLHNIPLLPAMIGFDAPAHLAYIDFIQTHGSLPAAGQGWEFFQGPLYYLMGAGVLNLFQLRISQVEGRLALALLNLAMGAAELAMVFAGLRLLFPARPRLQLAGLALAAFFPLQIYILHYPTNEIMGAVTTTAALFLCLKILRQQNAPMTWYAGVGAMLGLALLSKASAVVAAAAVVLALIAKGWVERQPPSAFLRNLALVMGLSVLIGGWHYWKLWRQFGSPFAGNWDSAIGGGWWQLPGFRDPSYYLSFGQSLSKPFFSGFHSFWDSLYSTFWGDGLMGGESILYGAPPWNYNLAAVAFVLALIPSGLVLTGFWRALQEGISRRRLDCFFVAGLPLLYGFAIFSMSLKLPFYSQSKALYALPVVLPFAALGALGLDFWKARFRMARSFLLVSLGVWLLTVYGSFWIRADTVQTRLSQAMALYRIQGQDPGPAFKRVLELDPRNPEAIVSLAYLDRSAGHLGLAVSNLEAAARFETNAVIDTALARCLGAQGRLVEALEWARRACALTVDYPGAPSALCSLALQAGANEEAARAGALSLRLKPQDAELHLNVGLALQRLNRYEDAAGQFSEAVDCSPQNPDAHFWLGMSLWNMPGKTGEARAQVALAIRLSPGNATWKSRLAEMQR